jgi:signal transduction histidine kinase
MATKNCPVQHDTVVANCNHAIRKTQFASSIPHWFTLTSTMKSQSVRFSLTLLAIGCVLPIMVMHTSLMLADYQRGQAQVVENNLSRARAVASAVDREFGNTQSALLALATSPQLSLNDLAAFHAQATVALSNLGAENIVLLDRTGQLLLTTARPFGEPLPKVANPLLLQRILKTGKPGVSDLFIGPIAGKLIYTIGVPVERDGSIAYSLNATASSTQLVRILAEQEFPESWRAAITDSAGSIVARTDELNQFYGKKAVPDLLKRMNESTDGNFETKTLEGIPVLTVFSRSTVTGWTVAIGAPLEELSAGIRKTLAKMLAVTLFALGIGFALAWFIGGRIASAFSELIKPAKALGGGETVTVHRLPINEANEVGEALLQAANLLEKANQAKADFLSTMSHELRTPLNAILGFAQLIEAGSPTPTPSQSKSLVQILKAGWHLLELVNEVLNLALVESGKVVPELDSVSLAEVMLECQIMIAPQAEKSGLSLTFPQFQTPCMVHVDRFWLNQCLINLLSNAIKFNQPNGAVVVECTTRQSDSVRISVRDTGAGLAPHQLAQFLQPLNRLARDHGVEKGSGVSLAVTKRLIELMGGTIGVDSAIGVGSTFWIELKRMPT